MLEDPPVLTIRRRFPRPSETQLRRFRGAYTAQVVDAMDGRGAMDPSIKPQIAPGVSIAAPVLTAFAHPADNLALFACIDVLAAGDVVVCAADNYRQTALTGDLLTGMLRNAGAIGLVTDGAVRDQDGIEGMGLPVWHGGVSPNSPARVGPGTVGLDILCGGVAVSSGDLVVADRDGVVIVPHARIDAVADRLEAIRSAEKDMEAKVRAGLARPVWLDDVIHSSKAKEVD
ncbi:MAG: RraA family protein [Alphaproteobacteria bacterium]|nr:RraA family protein [Alphaproteobacteria bacterium]